MRTGSLAYGLACVRARLRTGSLAYGLACVRARLRTGSLAYGLVLLATLLWRGQQRFLKGPVKKSSIFIKMCSFFKIRHDQRCYFVGKL